MNSTYYDNSRNESSKRGIYRGHAAMVHAIHTDGTDLAKTLNLLTDGLRTQTAADHFSGALDVVLACYFGLRDLGKVPRFKDPAIDEYMHSSRALITATIVAGYSRRDAKAAQRLGWMLAFVDKHRRSIRVRTVSGVTGKTIDL